MALEGTSPVRPFRLVRPSRADGYAVADLARQAERRLSREEYRILELCDGRRTVEEIAQTLRDELRATAADPAATVRAFVDEMSAAGFVAVREDVLVACGGETPPADVFWDITRICNLRCLHCYNDFERMGGPELSTREVTSCLDELAEFGAKRIVFSGGEPLSRPDMLEIAFHAGHAGFERVSVSTNGTLVDGDVARALKDAGVAVQVSLDGDTAEIHDRIRGVPGTFDRALRAIEHLRGAGVPLTVCMTAMRPNLDRVPGFVALMRSMGVEHRVQGVVPIGRARRNLEAIRLAPAQVKRLAQELVAERLSPGGYAFTLEPPTLSADLCASGACAAGTQEAAITFDGRVVPCTYFWSLDGDSLRDHSFRWIWENSLLVNYFRNVRLGELRSGCRACAWLAQCHGGCKAENYLDGDLFGENGSCWVACERRATERLQ